jgi:aspartate aminotransferase/aspartate/glutamate/aspartate-prephenate aminotransferase
VDNPWGHHLGPVANGWTLTSARPAATGPAQAARGDVGLLWSGRRRPSIVSPMHLAQRAQSISGSASLALIARVAELRADGVDVISLAAGEPDFPSPSEAIEAASAYIAKGHVGYTASSGIPELRAAAAANLKHTTGVDYAPSQVIVTCGAKEALALSILALCQAGDEVLVPTPAWISYDPMATIAEARTTTIPCSEESGFKLTPDALAAAITPDSRVLVLCSPSNPTGAVYTRDEFAALSEVLAGTDVSVVSDEIYWPFIYEGEFVSPASLPGMAERTIVVNGVSKGWSMTGWRIGWLGAPQPVASAIGNIKSHLTSNPAAPSQYAALAALQGGDAWPKHMLEAFARRRDIALEMLAGVPGISLAPPPGAFYVFPRIDAYYGPDIPDGRAFAQKLLEEQRVAALPGIEFGEDRCIRFSIATSDEQLREGLSRFIAFLSSLPTPSAPSPLT